MSELTDDEVLDAALDLVARWNDDQKWEFLEHRIKCMNIMRQLLEERKSIKQLVNAEPAMMTTPIGLLPVDSEGMRKLADYVASLTNKNSVVVKNENTDSKYIPPDGSRRLYEKEKGSGPWSFQE
jgi:hypothetical protein